MEKRYITRIFTTLAIFISILFFVSCNKDMNTNDIQKPEKTNVMDDVYADLIASINTCNEEFGITEDPATKGRFWNAIKKFFLCDSGGCILGSIFGGIGALVFGLGSSLLSAPIIIATESMSVPEKNYLDENVYISIAATQYDSIGVYHNIILRDIYNDDPDNFFSGDKNLSDVINKTKKYFPVRAFSILEIRKFNTFNNNLTNYVFNSDEEGLLAFYKEEFPEHSIDFDIIFMYYDALSSIGDIPDKIYKYHESFYDILARSSIPSDSKNLITSTISVAANSALFWQELTKEE